MKSDFSIALESATQLPLFSSILLEVCSKSISSALAPLCFMGDIIRRLIGVATSALDFCLSSNSNTTVAKRTRSVARVVSSLTCLVPVSVGSEDAVESQLSSLLSLRLHQGPDVAWENVDAALHKAFERPLVYPPPKGAVASALDVLRQENSNTIIKGQQVLIIFHDLD